MELYWERVPGIGVTYDVHRDGEYFDTTSGTSYFLEGLQGGREYRFKVLAVSASGDISSAASVTARTAGGIGHDAASIALLPLTPADASVAVYSSTAAELFWKRAEAYEEIVSTDVFRNGEYLGSSPGNSYFDPTRNSGQAYEYSLIAINASGARSEALVVKDGL